MTWDYPCERRHSSRLAALDSPSNVRTRVRPGRDVRLVDISRGGALIQATARLLPGREVELQVMVGDWQWAGSGEVTRCRVWALRLEELVWYRAAVRFLKPMDPVSLGRIEEGLRPMPTTGLSANGYLLPATGSIDPA